MSISIDAKELIKKEFPNVSDAEYDSEEQEAEEQEAGEPSSGPQHKTGEEERCEGCDEIGHNLSECPHRNSSAEEDDCDEEGEGDSEDY